MTKRRQACVYVEGCEREEFDLYSISQIPKVADSKLLRYPAHPSDVFRMVGFSPGLYLWVSLKLGRMMVGTVEGMSFRGPARQYDRQLSAPYEMYFGIYIKVNPSINCTGGKWTNESN